MSVTLRDAVTPLDSFGETSEISKSSKVVDVGRSKPLEKETRNLLLVFPPDE